MAKNFPPCGHIREFLRREDQQLGESPDLFAQQLPEVWSLPDGCSVHIAAQRWALEPWAGAPDPPDLEQTWC